MLTQGNVGNEKVMLTQRLPMAALPRESVASRESSHSLPIIFLSLYFFVEYVRPSLLAPIRPALLLQGILLVCLLLNFTKVMEVLKERYFILYLLLLLEMAIHGPMATNNYWALYSFVPLVTYLVVALACCVFIDRLERLKTLIGTFVVIGIIAAADKVLWFFKSTGYLTDLNDFALMMNVMIPIAFYRGLSQRFFHRGLYWLAAVLFIAANVWSLSRGGTVGMAAVALLCWLKSKFKVRSFILAIFIAITFVALVPEKYKSEMLTISSQGAESGTGRDRIELWKLAWKTFLHHPIMGVGQGNLPWVIGDYQSTDNDYWGRGINGRVIHSIYFTVLAELGIVGATLWALMLATLFWRSREVSQAGSMKTAADLKGDRTTLACIMNGLTVGLVGYLVSGIFLSAFYYPEFWNLSGIMIATSRIFRNKRS